MSYPRIVSARTSKPSEPAGHLPPAADQLFSDMVQTGLLYKLSNPLSIRGEGNPIVFNDQVNLTTGLFLQFTRLQIGAAAKVANRDYRLVEMYTFVAVVYFVISFGLSILVKHLQVRIAIIR